MQRVEDFDFCNIEWPINVEGWPRKDVLILANVIEELGIEDNLCINGKFIYSRNKKFVFRCLFGHLWNMTNHSGMMGREMNTCMRCGKYAAGPE